MSRLLSVQEAIALWRRGEIVAFPTETVYGLGAPVFNPDAVRKVFQAKKRPIDNPLIVHISQIDQVEEIAQNIPHEFYHLAEHFFPGPLTILLEKRPSVSSLVSAGLPTIGVRMPRHPLALELINTLAEPLAAPSANLSGKPSSTCAQHVLHDFGQTIGGVVDGGPTRYGVESTVLQLSPVPVILRPGTLKAEEIEALLKKQVKVVSPVSHGSTPLSPGMKYRHYAPKAPLVLCHSEEQLKCHLHAHSLHRREIFFSIKPEQLYTLLREIESKDLDEVVILCDATMQQDVALMNRLYHAAGIEPPEMA